MAADEKIFSAEQRCPSERLGFMSSLGFRRHSFTVSARWPFKHREAPGLKHGGDREHRSGSVHRVRLPEAVPGVLQPGEPPVVARVEDAVCPPSIHLAASMKANANHKH